MIYYPNLIEWIQQLDIEINELRSENKILKERLDRIDLNKADKLLRITDIEKESWKRIAISLNNND